ncbi:flagellar inner arm dynein 1 heavy chain alpha [Achlya hypogyna]|uniref:Dynein-1, subspecies f n=1 Tax=Achlya hypogyna TaxID=1202772 RepID=A0A1V9YMK9_ACHHY|nr:flagellar inner arm dynein 1 heavy chain alpha [Achlya hypogyna]
MDEISRWVRRLVCKGLDIDDDVYNRVFEVKKPATRDVYRKFFSPDTPAGHVLFFYTTQFEVDVEVEIEEEVDAPAKATVEPPRPEEPASEEARSLDNNGVPGPVTVEQDERDLAMTSEASVEKIKAIRRITTREAKDMCNVTLDVLPVHDRPCVFFIKSGDGPVTIGDPDTEDIATNVEVGCSTGDLLANLEGVICHVFIPVLDPKLLAEGGYESDLTEAHHALKVIDAVRNEFRGNLVKFASQISNAMQQIQGDVHLVIPNVVIDKPEACLDDYELINTLEQALEEWYKVVAMVVDQEARKAPKRKGPLAEIEFWRERNATLSTIFEQINMPHVQKMLTVLELVEAAMLSTFRYHFSELSKQYIEAKDNVKFLTTLERHFKNLAVGSFSTIADTLPSMMNAIRMVWIISRHYNTDERMVPLMERIASEIADKVAGAVNIHTILRKAPETALHAIEEAKMVLDLWHTTYMKVRERIEASGTDHRWEFDRKRLFDQTSYMSKICENLQEVATVLDQFHKFLGPELKSVTGDSQGIDDVMARVEGLIAPFENVPFRIFDRGYKTSWESVMVQFREKVTEIETMTRKFIDTSFQKLRSAEGAFDLLQNFQNIQSRDSINKQMMEKYKDILMQYSKELEKLTEQFEQYKAAPPIYKSHPPVAGAIAWARALYHRAKKPIMRFRAMHDLLKSPHGEEVKDKYLVFARAVDAYIRGLHQDWKDKVPATTNEYLKQPILGPPLIETHKVENGAPVLKLPLPPFYPNFAPELSMIIREAKYMDRLGFDIPEEALNVTLQEDKYHQIVQDLKGMLKQYDALLKSLTPVETYLLRGQLRDLDEALRVGFYPLNWNSQRIFSFIEASFKALNQFGNIVSQVHKSAKMIDEVVVSIENAVLIKISDYEDGVVTEVGEFYELMERNRVARIEELVQNYRSIGPLLIKVEEVVAGVNTGCSPKLATYYMYWERRIFNAITKMIIASMTTFQALLNVHQKDVFKTETKLKRPPLCKIKATMNGKDIVVTPSLSDMYKYLSKCVKHIVESAKAFARWMHGTCRETEPQVANEDDEPITFTFYTDISQNPYVIKMTLSLNQEIHKVFNIINKYLDSWRRYDTVYALWNPKRRAALDKLADKKPSCVYFDARMASYARLAESVRSQPTEKETDFLQINCLAVAVAIAKQAEKWKDDYGQILLELSTKKLAASVAVMDAFEKELVAAPADLASLKALLNTIARIAASSMAMELDYCDIAERYRTLQTYAIAVADLGEANRAFDLEARWKSLVVASKTKDLRLVHVKDQFRVVTKQDTAAFATDCKAMRVDFFSTGPGGPLGDLDRGLELVHEFKARLAAFKNKRQELVNAENLFSLPLTAYPELQEVADALEKHEAVYALYIEQKEFITGMSGVLWGELDVAFMTKGIDELEKTCRKFPKDLRAMSTFQEVEKQILAFKESIPLIASLKNDAMKPRHWEELMTVTQVKFDMNLKTFTLGNLFAMQLHRFAAEIGDIVNAAMQEAKIEMELQKIEDVWAKATFEVAKYKKNGTDRGWVLRTADDLKLTLEDHMLNLQTMSGSRFIASFSDRVRKWERKLNIVNECIDVWFVVQRKWMYLESIFIGAEDIRLQLPEEAKKFDALDKAWKGIMAATYKNANAVDACTTDNRTETLVGLSERLDKCQKSLSDYLDTKRNSFPRFFFISDDELLSVLGSSDPTSIQVHMLKLFDNVKLLSFARNNRNVTAMESSEGEGFGFRTVAVVEGPVEQWMTGVEDEMRVTLQVIAKEGVFHYARTPRTQWLGDVLGMVGLVGSQIWWTWEVEDVFHRVAGGNKYAMKELETKLTGQLNDLVRQVREPLPKQTRKKVNTLLIIDVHARDIVDSFVRDSILHEKEFAWESQLRFYWDKDVDDVVIKQCTGTFRYGYEYMGLNGRLVITPLTDRCYMTLTQALTFKLGGSPAGPAGTGKTETVKDLAKSLALPCYVINCGEGLDYKAMGSIFSGLVQVGAWGCFDEFNRINIEVLSVVSAQLRAIQNALNTDKPTVDIGFGTEIAIHRTAGFATCGFFITMNPGYAGRTELPDNLKALFRPVTMIVPDLLMICQIMLFSEGFENAVALAKKMTVLYKLSREQLSKQYHYDFGLRALKSVLVMAGSLKREYSDMSEDLVLMRALRDSNMPKFVFEDVPLFHGLINDLFPGLDCPRVGYATLKDAIEADLDAGDYRTSDAAVFREQTDKIIQMYETMLVRHTTMIVGPTGGGKSLVLQTLANASKVALDEQVKIFVLNPKAQSVAELYGTMDPVTRDWTDGVLSKLFRELNQPLPTGKETEKRWLIYDGDVDAVWVENMNSVMDDNKLLTLPNGERIRLQTHCCMICETFDLQYASPATISRCGMVWVDPKNLGYRPFYERWLKKRTGDDKGALLELFDQYVPKCVDYILEGTVGKEVVGRLTQVIPISNMEMCKQLTNAIDSYFPATPVERVDLEGLFLFCVVWSLGAGLVDASRRRFDEFLKTIATASMPTQSLYECFYNPETHKWQTWDSKVPAYVEPAPFNFSNVLVPTTDSVLYSYILGQCMQTDRPLLFVGESGTAKTVTVTNYLQKLDPQTMSSLSINFSSRTSSADVLANIQANVDKRTGKIYGPPAGKKLAIFIDDLNMPKVDLYGTQQPIALLHFVVSKGCMYDRGKDLDLRILKDLQYIGAMGPPGGGRNQVDPRFVALFNVYNLTPPTKDVLRNIYGSILTTYLRNFAPPVQDAGAKLTDVLLRLFDVIVDKLPPTPSKFHYIFNLRDLGRVCEGVCMATPDKFDSSAKLVRLWRNEVQRVFADRLTSTADLGVVDNAMAALLNEVFPSEAPTALVDPLLFGDYADCRNRLSGGGEDLRLYQDMESYKRIQSIFEEVLETYNLDNKPMALVLFEMALEHLSRILRIIRNPLGHALLIGVGGSGKQSLSRLAAFTAGYELFEIFLTRGYGEAEFRENLKDLYRKLGKTPVVFLFTDAHAVEEGFLEFINNMLTTGIVPALFEQDEKDQLGASVRQEVKAAGWVESNENCWKFYVQRCRQHLHVVLAMSPSGTTLRVRCRNFPGLVSASVIDWFFSWPEDALRNVARYFLMDEKIPDEHRPQVVDHLVHAHLRVVTVAHRFAVELRRYYYVTPKNYLDFIANYRLQLKENNQKVNASIVRLKGGLTKLVEASGAVDRMQIELSEKKIIVDEKTVACEALIKTIGEKSAIASKQQEVAAITQIECEKASVVIAKEKEEADAALLEALPAVEAAAQALQDLSKADLTEIKSFASPPALVMSVCMCVLILRPTGQDLDLDWKGAKVMLSNPNLLNLLKEYEKDKITAKMIAKIKTFFKNPDLNLETMRSISKAGSGLLVWVIAIVKYYDVARNVEPLKLKVKTMEKEQAVKEQELLELKETLERLTVDLNGLSAAFEAANTELQGLKSQADQMQKRLSAASKLLSGLASEKTRWTRDIESLNLQGERLIGDCLLTASFLSYAGAFSFDYRYELIYVDFLSDVAARKLPATDPFKLESSLTNDATVQKWVAEGLPADEHSVQNGILTTKASRFPLCIDPQQQAVTWIKRREEKNNLTVKTLNDGDFMKHLELAIQFGNPFLFEAVDEELDPILDPVLEKSTFMEGSQRLIKLGDKNVEWDANFRLYFTSKLANPHYSPEVMGKTMIVNYSVTQAGLANQLLNVVVAHERPDLEEQYRDLVRDMSENTQMIVELEDTLLHELSTSTGNILDNEELIVTLDETKNKATEIGSKLDQSKFTKDEITKARAVYTPVALRGSIMYFAMSSLSTIMKMYEISLTSFLTVFNAALDNAKRDVVLEKRLRFMIQSITEMMYDYTCTGIFERHKLMLSFQMTVMIMASAGDLHRPELDFFLKGDTSLEAAAVAKPESLMWVAPAGWKDLLCLTKMGGPFETLLHDVTTFQAAWQTWYELEAPETSPFPCEYTTKLTPLQQLLIYRCFRQDRVYNAMKLFVISVLGEKYVQPPVLDYARIYAQSAPTAPIVCILSPGADPQSDIQTLGEATGFSGHKFKFLALGQGQGPLAEQMLEAGYTRGHWVLLQNCHLLASWLRTLEKTLLAMHKPHRDFRLWLTTEPTDRFPLGILQRSLKVVTEPPDGLKQNMRSLYSKLDEALLDECPHPAFKQVVFVLCFLHAVVLERRKYGKIGWNVSYDFNESDFNISRKLLALYLHKAYVDGDEQLPWGSLKYLIGDAMYGGRVSDDYDRRVLTTYLSEYMGDFLFDDCQPFYFSRSGFDYRLPTDGPLESYLATVEALPLTNSPAVFGLHPNAEIGYYTNMTKSVWRDLISLQPRSAGSGGGISREDYITSIATDIESKVPEAVDVGLIRKRLGGTPTPTQVVLLQELDRWNVLTAKMATSLGDLQKALIGEIGMSDELDAVGSALFDGFLPNMWRALCPKTEKPLGSWMVHFMQRYAQYMAWVDTGDPTVMWLSGLGIPESYLTALVQTTCRAKNWPLDKSTLYTTVTKFRVASEVPAKLESGCYVSGLYLEGASWDLDRSCLCQQLPKKLVEELPILQVIPIEASRLKLQNTFRTPVYVTQSRRNAMGVGLVFEADLFTGDHMSHWVLQGVALALNTDS